MRKATILAVLLGCLGYAYSMGAVDNRYVEREEKRFKTTGKPDVSLSTFDGPIEIRSWSRSEVEVIVEKRGADKEAIADITVNAAQTANHIEVKVDRPRHQGLWFGPSTSAKLIVSLPASSDVLAKSGDGGIDVERITGKVELRSGDGAIRGRDLAGDVDVETGDGSIALEGKFGTLRARSGDGSLKIRAARGTGAASDWDISTGDGPVTLELPEGLDAELDARTGDGEVAIDDLTLSNVSGKIPGNRLKGRLGSGGPVVRVRTGDGSIRLLRS